MLAEQCAANKELNSFIEETRQLKETLGSDKIDTSKLDEVDSRLTPIISAKEKFLGFRLPNSESAASTNYGKNSPTLYVQQPSNATLILDTPLVMAHASNTIK